MRRNRVTSDFIQYLATTADLFPVADDFTAGNRLPTLQALSEILGVSVSRLREQMEVARVLGFVDVRPRTGIRRRPYTFLPAVRQSLDYAIKVDRSLFEHYSDLRNHVEAAYWYKAVDLLEETDKVHLHELVDRAWQKLRGRRFESLTVNTEIYTSQSLIGWRTPLSRGYWKPIGRPMKRSA